MALTKEERDEKARKALFVPCDSMERLHAWIKFFLRIDFPHCRVDPESNSSPMEMIWEVYSNALANKGATFNRVMYYASRDSYKTLGAAVLELLVLLHMSRDVAHMAAIEAQSDKAQSYVKRFMGYPYLRDYLVGDSQKTTVVARFNDPRTGKNLTEEEWKELPREERDSYTEIRNYIKVVICTMQGANSDHVPFFCVEGDTKILARIPTDKHGRNRKPFTARGLFRRLQGMSGGGRPGPENAEVCSEPEERIELLSLNTATGEWSFNPIVRAQKSFRPVLRLTTKSGRKLVCTPDEPVLVMGRGFVQAGDLAVGDKLVSPGRAKSERGSGGVENHATHARAVSGVEWPVNDRWHQVVLGSLLGDCGVYQKPGNNPYLQEQHCIEQAGYVAWKREVLSENLRTVPLTGACSGYTGEAQVGYRTGNSPLLKPYVSVRTNLDLVDTLGPLGLAVWYMDDGCSGNQFRLSTEGFTEEQNERLKRMLWERFQIQVDVVPDRGRFFLRGAVEAKRRLVELCAEFVRPELAYKFDLSGNQATCAGCGKVFWFYERGARNVRDCGDPLCRMVVQEQTPSLQSDELAAVEPAGESWVYDFTVAGDHNFVANGLVIHNCVDEVDVVTNPAAYEEAKAIPAPYNGIFPITMLISTRKISTGLVQKEIDEAVDADGNVRLQIRHWNIIDVTEACPPERHLPERKKLPIYVDDNELRALSEKKYNDLSPEQKLKFKKEEGYAGCIENCKLFAACKGRLATEQKSKSKLLRPIDHVINQIGTASVPFALAQYLCRKPSTEGLIYPNLERETHVISAAEMAEMLTGTPFPKTMSKRELLALVLARGCAFFSGMDFGFSHNFAVVTGFVDGQRAFIVDVISQKELLPDEQIKICQEQIRALMPAIYADPENKQMVEMFRKNGFRMRDWKKTPGSLVGGIDIVRMRLRPPMGEPLIFFLRGDAMVDLLVKRMMKYHWKVDAAGRLTNVPNDVDDDECDACRYFIMNVFPAHGRKARVAEDGVAQSTISTGEPVYTKENWIREWLAAHGITDQEDGSVSGKKGRFAFII